MVPVLSIDIFPAIIETYYFLPGKLTKGRITTDVNFLSLLLVKDYTFRSMFFPTKSIFYKKNLLFLCQVRYILFKSFVFRPKMAVLLGLLHGLFKRF